jgi:hypothetical protein
MTRVDILELALLVRERQIGIGGIRVPDYLRPIYAFMNRQGRKFHRAT